MIQLAINLSAELFNIKLLHTNDFMELLMRFIFNLGITLVIVRYIYYPSTHRRDFLFTFLLIGIMVFLMCFLLESVKLQLGFALGLFAIFGIIRYRTTQIPIKEMTYLFIVIGLSVVNALSNKKVSYAELLFTNIAVISVTYFTNKFKSLENESFTIVHYENIEKATPAHRDELINELENRLGIKIARIEFNNFNYQKKVVKIIVYFYKSHQTWADDEQLEYRTLSGE